MSEYSYFNRDLSWLSFNKRILMEAADSNVPLFDRIKFLAIYSSNLDEFFRVRVASLRSIITIDKNKINKKLGFSPAELLEQLLAEVNEQQEEFGRIKREMINPELERNGIIIYRDERLHQSHQIIVRKFFKSKVLSYLQPQLLLNSNKDLIFLENRKLYLLVDLLNQNEEEQLAILNIPSDHLNRFVSLGEVDNKHYFMYLDDVIKTNMDFLFPGFNVKGCYAIKLNRDADLHIDDEYSGNLVKKIRKQIAKRNLGVPSRFLYDKHMPIRIRDFIKAYFDLDSSDMVEGGRYHNMHDLFTFPNPIGKDLESKPIEPLEITKLEQTDSVFTAIEQNDILLNFPYQSYDYVLRFFNEAAFDPDVTDIKATFYRVAPESFICNALISAASNGKKVTVFVEIKARFDEDNNLKWAEKMERAGIKIIYSLPGLKVHAKVALVKKKKENHSVWYGFFGTGNFNEKTASIYADQALLTTDGSMNTDLDNLFMYLSEGKEISKLNNLLISQINIIDKFKEKIDREIDHVHKGHKGRIIIKVNNLEDQEMIAKLYEANNAGVQIDLIVRSICCLIPGIIGQSERIKVHRIVDTYLEHSRAFYFFNNGKTEVYQGSSDWMSRNLRRRIEAVFPVKNASLQDQIIKMLDLQIGDDVKGVYVDENLQNVVKQNKLSIRCQKDYPKWLSELSTAGVQ